MSIEESFKRNEELKDKHIVLEYDGSVYIYDGADYVKDVEGAPKDLKVEDGSFQKFAEQFAKKNGLTAQPEVEWKHVFRLE